MALPGAFAKIKERAMANAAKAHSTQPHSGPADPFARDHLPPRELWPEFLFTRPELQYPDRLNCVVNFLDRWVEQGRGEEPCIFSPERQLQLSRAAAIGEPHRQRAGRQARPGDRRPGAAALGQQADDGGDLSRGAEGRRHRGRDHAAAARQGTGLSDPEGEDRAGAVRRQARRRNGKGQGHRAEAAAHRLLGQPASPVRWRR